jgi:methylglutaconyl-CoA hydratase
MMDVVYHNIKTSYQDGIFTLILSRGHKRNALDEQTMDELHQAFASLPADAFMAILTAQGQDFCAGADLEWMKTTQQMEIEEITLQNLKLQKVFESWYHLPVFTITLVQGRVIGGGIGLVAASDLVIASPEATFRFSEVTLGLIPATISPFVFQRTRSRLIRNAMLTAQTIDTQSALDCGLIDYIADNLRGHSIIDEYRLSLNKTESGAVAATKKLANDIHMNSIKEDLDIYTSNLLARARKSESASRRINSFFNSTLK